MKMRYSILEYTDNLMYTNKTDFSKPDIEIPGGSKKRTKNFGEGDKDG